ncbi:MAG TPA: hypothetical protein PK029_04440 [Bacteroidales bacterium]|nr:MAG: preprotein translocase subunit SecD [Bacteroidetes bacterium ADurb.Bin217]HPH16397.1 hypothetical protein [Bacteroidales bacterium]
MNRFCYKNARILCFVVALLCYGFHASGQVELKKAKLEFTVHSDSISIDSLNNHLTSLKFAKMTITKKNNSIHVTCNPIFEQATIQTLIQKGFTYEIYPGVSLPSSVTSPSSWYSSHEIDTQALRTIQELPEISSLNLQSDWFIWRKIDSYFYLHIINKHNSPAVSEQNIQKISIGLVEEKPVIEMTHSPQGQQQFHDFTKQNINNYTAILIQNQIVLYPYIIDVIDNQSVWITGLLEDSELKKMIALLFFHPYWQHIQIENCKI